MQSYVFLLTVGHTHIPTYVYAYTPTHVGMHPGNRQTYGHSLVIDPWGRVLAELDGESSCHKVLDIDTDLVFEAREKIPSLVMGRELKF